MNPATTTRISTAQIASRIAAAALGGWAFTWGFVSLTITAVVATGQPYTEAHTAAMLLAFLVLLTAFCWSFAAASVVRVWAVLAGGAALMTGAAWLLQASLL
jgi:hypothetical protein